MIQQQPGHATGRCSAGSPEMLAFVPTAIVCVCVSVCVCVCVCVIDSMHGWDIQIV